ncbi:mannose-1-phosphate guanylyltransferase/mannose-6-phosphate isomerase [Undibacterium griseum]|uniref:mannose-1-phosphate guanylyltransferase n=1 Tax=Undibacterium griseum TaxID=2762295 RepID=A0ABR6YLW8_9BURK|nr:mannose-1-phosphate guanylyltransferase/mannose-6-phosphate isomerase [Undibacterium griseum]MBC3884785.1 mannose-1-phosphate guanylyltransferase/mannose-6-phosphate isomerase [Undibacterium griseum]
MIKVAPVILCGGSGTRLWPLSRGGFPKQFLVLSGKDSLFQQAVQRVNDIAAQDIQIGQTLIVTNEEHRFLALDQLRELKNVSASLLLEPVGKNTAPALTLAALASMAEGDDPVLVVTPADQTVGDPDAFREALRQSVRAAQSGDIVILGVTPDRAETGYGYIRHDGAAGLYGEYTVRQFEEKPDAITARHYLDSGEYAWNSGMFVLRASTWLKALQQFRPDIAETTEISWQGRSSDAQFIRPAEAAFRQIPAESVDYAVMEQCPASALPIRMIPLNAGWNDLGAWDAVWQTGNQDPQGNVCHGDVLQTDTGNSLIYSSGRLVSTVGVSNLIVIETPDAVLVADRNRSQDVKAIVSMLGEQKRTEHTLHRKVHRPWGWYDSIDEEERFKVKRIQVKPGASLSLQKHHHRAEHWIVVRGTAEVTCGDKVSLVTENQSTYIPLGEVHRLANPGTIPLEIIEVQSGSYLGEDDIVRFDDFYGRTKK